MLETRTENLSVSFESWLIEVIDVLCREAGKSRSAYIADCVRAHVLQKHEGAVWQELYNHIVNKSS